MKKWNLQESRHGSFCGTALLFSRQFLFAVAVNVFTAPNNIAPGIDRIGHNG